MSGLLKGDRIVKVNERRYSVPVFGTEEDGAKCHAIIQGKRFTVRYIQEGNYFITEREWRLRKQ